MIKLELTEQEYAALAGLLDAGVRATGLRSVRDASVLVGKMEFALASAQAAAQAASAAAASTGDPTPTP